MEVEIRPPVPEPRIHFAGAHAPGWLGAILALLTMLAAFFVGFMALFGKTLIDPESLRMLLFGGALIVMMLYRPAGLLPSRVRRRELDGDEMAEQP